MTDSTLVHRIGVTVPDIDQALRYFGSLIGPSSVDTAGATVRFEPGIEVALSRAAVSEDPPRIVDIGANHLCFRVADIEQAVAHLETLSGTTVLGDIMTVPAGPIAGNRWIYFRSPWGTLFELQQWPEVPGYIADTTARLFHGHRAPEDAPLPSVLGLDHSGYSVSDLEAALEFLKREHAATVVLRTEISADRAFMRAQFGIDVEGTSAMAMVVVGDGLNIELFEHRVGAQEPPRPLDRLGGNYLALGGAARSAPDVVRTPFGLLVDGVAVR
ncbi:VOC family protein [Nocardia sp. NPDC051030]|uniref:VOC family protein n=1 Tax=Nocardia sp. NPDC051030 TaxID=3155162 RepID=UPI00341D88DA